MMSKSLPKMNKLIGGIHKFNGYSLYTQKDNPKLLVIEDLAPLGFRMADRQAGLDIEHALLAIRGLAKFHACSVKLFELVNKKNFIQIHIYIF